MSRCAPAIPPPKVDPAPELVCNKLLCNIYFFDKMNAMDDKEISGGENGYNSNATALIENENRRKKIIEKVKSAFSRKKHKSTDEPTPISAASSETVGSKSIPINPEPLEEPDKSLDQNQKSSKAEEAPETDESEHKDIAPAVYIGLERLGKIREDESLLQSAIYFADFNKDLARKEILEKRLSKLDEERKALYERCGLTEADIENIVIHDEILISQLLTRMAADRLPPLKEGDARMYRGEGPYNRVVADDSMSGRWFSPKVSGTFFNGRYEDLPARRLTYVDVPASSLRQYHAADMEEFKGAGKKDEYVLPREIANKSKEFVRFMKADTKGDPWAKPLLNTPTPLGTRQ